MEHEALKNNIISPFFFYPIRFAYRQHVVAFLINDIIFFGYVELTEEIERDHSVTVDSNREKHHCENQLKYYFKFRIQK